MEYRGFWSYVHNDDEAESGRIVRLAKDLTHQFETLAGEPINLFLDREDIGWGEDWRDKIDQGLSSVAFFIPVLTPRYFLSAECRRELQLFARKAERLGVKDLVLPLLYVDVPDLHSSEPEDDLIKLTQTFHWQDWRELRFENITSAEYRRAVAGLAERLVKSNRQAEQMIVPIVREQNEVVADQFDDDSPGILDRLAGTEEAIPRWTETLNAISHEIERVGDAMKGATDQIQRSDSQGRGFAGRVKTARFLAARLHGPTDRVRSLGSEFASQLHEVDSGIRAIIELAPEAVNDDSDARRQVCEFFRAVRVASAEAHQALETVQRMIHAVAPLDQMSRDLRPPLRRLRQGLTSMLEARRVTAEWVARIEETQIACDDELH